MCLRDPLVTTTAPGTPGRRSMWIGALLAVALAGLIAWVVGHHGRPLSWDLALHAAALQHRSPALTNAAIVVTTTGEVPAYVVAALGGLLALRPRRWWGGALAGVALLGAGQLLRLGLAIGIGRARPPSSEWAWPASGFALPSGHTTTASLAAGLLCLGLARGLRGVRRAVGVTLAACWAAAVGVTRVYLGVHWPTDVLAGWLLGGLLTVLASQLLLSRPLGRAAVGAEGPAPQHQGGRLEDGDVALADQVGDQTVGDQAGRGEPRGGEEQPEPAG